MDAMSMLVRDAMRCDAMPCHAMPCEEAASAKSALPYTRRRHVLAMIKKRVDRFLPHVLHPAVLYKGGNGDPLSNTL